MTVLSVEDLHTQFHTDEGTVRAVDGVDLDIEEGEIVGLVGESGSGKSVLAESVMGLLEDPGEIVEGDVVYRGQSLLSLSETRMQEVRGGDVAMVFQDPMNSLNPTLTVGEQIAETVRLHQDVGESTGLPAEIKRKLLGAVRDTTSWRQAIEMLEAVEIPEPATQATKFPHQFSGGMRQRAMIAMALAGEPDLLIADEPTTALDVTIQAQILDELLRLQEEFDTAILLITHDLAVVAEVADRVNVMYAGEIVERAGAEELFDNPRHPYTQALLESTPRIDDPRESLEAIPGTVPSLVDIEYACHFAPRCEESELACFEREPDFRGVGATADHEAACHHRGESASPREERGGDRGGDGGERTATEGSQTEGGRR
ncbi:MAG: ABC transporter ATP-binding protein [Halanaeroarchaeum sp.]